MSSWPSGGSVRTLFRGLVSPGHRPLRPRRATTLLAAVATLALALPGAASASVEDEPDGGVRLVLNGLQAVVGPATSEEVPASEQNARLPSTFSARALVENPGEMGLDNVRLVVEVYAPVRSRSALRAALDEQGPVDPDGSPRVVVDQQLDPVPARGVAQVELAIEEEQADLVVDDEDVVVRPVVVSVVQGRRILDEVRTASIGVARSVPRPLEAVLLLALDGPAPATHEPLDRTAPALLPGGRLDRLLRALEGGPPGVVTAAPAPHAVEDLMRLVDSAVPGAPDVLGRLQAVSEDRAAGIVSSPYALADVPALTAMEATEDLATAAIVAGRQRLLALVGAAPDGAHLLLAPQTPTSLDLAPADVLVMAWDDSLGPDLAADPTADIPPGLRTTRSSSGRSLDVLVGDPWVTTQLASATGRHGWAVDAHRVVAETAITFAQAPGVDGRALAVVPPLGWDAPGRLPDEVVARLAAAPWLRLADPVTVAARSRAGEAWEPPATVGPDRTPLLSRLGVLQDRLDGLAAAVTDVEVQPAVVERSGDLLRAVSTWPVEDPVARAGRILDGLEEGIDEAVGEVLVPDDSVVTLASERGVIPITVRHPEGVPMDVLVEVVAPGGLTFEQGTTRPVRLEEGGTATVSFEARALGRGTFPLAVTVRTPTGDVVLARGLVSVRASAVSRPALIGVGGVVLLLLVLGRLRRPRRPRLEVVR